MKDYQKSLDILVDVKQTEENKMLAVKELQSLIDKIKSYQAIKKMLDDYQKAVYEELGIPTTFFDDEGI